MRIEICLIFFVVSVLVMLNSVCSGEVLNIVTTEFCPYVCNPEKESGQSGFVIDIFKAIFEKQGYAVKFEVQPWTRALKTYNDKGAFDGLVAATKLHPVNKEIAVFPETEICMYTHKFYAPKDSPLVGKWRYNGLESLKEIKLGDIHSGHQIVAGLGQNG